MAFAAAPAASASVVNEALDSLLASAPAVSASVAAHRGRILAASHSYCQSIFGVPTSAASGPDAGGLSPTDRPSDAPKGAPVVSIFAPVWTRPRPASEDAP